MKYEENIKRGFDELLVNFEIFVKWITQVINFIERVFGKESQHYIALIDKWNHIKIGLYVVFENFQYCNAICEAAYNDYCAGYLFDTKKLITADVFDDFLEMAEYLLEEKYKDASVILIGGVLEDTLRKLCVENSIKLPENPKIDWMNIELAKKDVYNKLVQKNITAWADIRNNAAHGKYDKYEIDDVEDMMKGVRRFITKHLT